MNAEHLLHLATEIAREAGALLRSYAGRDDLDIATKTTATDPVSAADRAAEQLISDRVSAARPDDGMVGEERAGDRTGTTGVRWVVDPLDGTVNFLYGIPQWAVSIGVEDDDGVIAGVVYDPSRDETFAARRGAGATLDGSPLRMTPPDGVESALVATGYSYDAKARREQAAMLVDLIADIRDVRRCGSAALDLAWLAAGRWDGYAEFGLNHWDRSAGSAVVTEAGGRVSRWRMQLGGTGLEGVAAGSPPVHDHLTNWLQRHGAHQLG
ncbi:MAG TPA: inositol monophosphatase family protein [Euzebyales bacterium]|nr:inositol monophosphatase family protein [Euzebyales bacterium]